MTEKKKGAILLMHSEREASTRHIEALMKIVPDLQVHQVKNEEDAIQHAPDAVYIFGHRYLRQVLPSTTKLSWVQLSGGGFDHIPMETLQTMGVCTTRFTGASRGIAIHAISLALALNRKLPQMTTSQYNTTFDTSMYQSMFPLPKNITIIGLGAIGLEIARLMRPICHHIRGVKKHQALEGAALVDEICTGDDWKKKVVDTDILFVCLPITAETASFVDEKALTSLPSHAIVVNVGRYDTIDNEVMYQMLNAGTLGGAAIDVFPRPFDEGVIRRLFRVKNLLISPYTAARYEGKVDEFETFCELQLKRMVGDITPENIVVIDK